MKTCSNICTICHYLGYELFILRKVWARGKFVTNLSSAQRLLKGTQQLGGITESPLAEHFCKKRGKKWLPRLPSDVNWPAHLANSLWWVSGRQQGFSHIVLFQGTVWYKESKSQAEFSNVNLSLEAWSCPSSMQLTPTKETATWGKWWHNHTEAEFSWVSVWNRCTRFEQKIFGATVPLIVQQGWRCQGSTQVSQLTHISGTLHVSPMK